MFIDSIIPNYRYICTGIIFFVSSYIFMICFDVYYCYQHLHFATCGYRLAMFRLQSGSTALIFAAQSGRTECVRVLVEAGADKDAKKIVRETVSINANSNFTIGSTNSFEYSIFLDLRVIKSTEQIECKY